MSFDERQRQYYLGELNRALPVAKTPADMATIQAALGGVDPAMPAATRQAAVDVELLSQFGTGVNSRVLQRDAACRALPAPSPSMRPDPSSRTGCGWWYVADPATPSSGAYGTRRGPMSPNLDTQVGQGSWIWDPVQAQQMEAQKQAARVPTCSDIATAQQRFPTMGWCPSTNRAVLADREGNPLYPRMAGGDCPGGGIITDPTQCSQPSGPAPPSSISSQCSSSGPLTPACMYAITTNTCSPQGSLASIYGAGNWPAQDSTFATMNQVLQQRNFTIDSRIVQGGQLAVSDAMAAVSAIAQAPNQPGQDSRVAGAAANLCRGTPYNPCQFAPTDNGPFPDTCLSQMALGYGFSPQGTAMPGNSAANWSGTWADVTGKASYISRCADDVGVAGSPQEQATCIGYKYGTTVKYPKQGCNNNGVYMYRYSFPGLFPATGPLTHFLGRYILKNGFPNYGSSMTDQMVTGGNLTEIQRMDFNWIPTEGGIHQFQVQTDDVVNMYVTQSPGTPPKLYANIGCCGTLINTTPINWIVPGQQYTWTVDFVNGGGPWSFGLTHSTSQDGGNTWAPFAPMPLAEMFLSQDRRLPMIDLSFHRMPQGTNNTTIADTNGVLQTLSLVNAPIGQVAGRPCMQVLGKGSGVVNCLNGYNQGIRLAGLKSFTMMICITGSDGQNASSAPSPFAMYNLPDSQSYLVGTPRQTGGQGPNQDMSWPKRPQAFGLYIPGGGGSSGLVPYCIDSTNPAVRGIWATSAPMATTVAGQWAHVAFVWDTDLRGYTLYMNGNVVGTQRVIPPAVNQIYEQIRIGTDITDDAAWTGGIQWFRAFDYQLSQAQIQMDMADNWASLV